ncbi:MAG: glycosyltransferase family 2 protein [Candidatus Omnitrophota bacterium]|nr:glycosyltransferase family 2 protein [Candidatus Omnitrophota bacterium]MBU1929360.1 glycosyltransferase family 2 protein [Candidatus Omnitrophota bacterium]MBU2035652.1 glycosyltransferase family 2 protein [Candidatus Omnitrophota bacterium]MBU2221922.1 glycosyltransferase family 2 protein [Candidatus Omnitrophota bacterium]MBU2258678.1 glycosyltransferase family 2 protein [Candidatus Omnitrophota bacterium]
MISVIVVTYNRKVMLKECLDSILKHKPSERFEVIVIDNGSSDGTETLLENAFGDKIRFIRYASRKSLWEAKNSGIKEACGDIIAFTDDDCVVSEKWLIQLKRSLIYSDFVGGPTYATADTRLPWWWRDSLNWLIGLNPKPDKKFLPLGSNVAFNKNTLSKLEEKKINLSYFPLPYAEDRIRLARLIKTGLLMGINKEMIVYHRVPLQRLKIAYLIKRSYDEGMASVTLEREIKIVIFNLIALAINPIRMTLSTNLNYFFRTIVNLSYIINLLKTSNFK